MPLPSTHVSLITRYLATFLAGLLVGVLIIITNVYLGNGTLRMVVDERIETQIATVESLAEITDRNGADEVVSEIIRDCNQTDRRRFDELMTKLNESIRRTELLELQTLFGSCGDFYAVQKASMVARLDREVALLAEYLSIAAISEPAAPLVARISDWERVVELEYEQASTFVELSNIERELIESLVAGKSLQSEELQEMLTTARAIQSRQETLNIEIDTLRASLVTS